MTPLALATAITFVITLSQDRQRVTFRYPVNEGVTWVEACLEAEGHGDADKGESAEPWYHSECWPPHHNHEQKKLRPGTVHIRGHLRYHQDNQYHDLHTPVYQVRPE